MEQRRSSGLAWGVILILVGLLFLAMQFVPGWADFFFNSYSWPLIIVGVGGIFLLIGLLTSAPGLVVPACIIGGIGGLLYWQNLTGNWESWAYAWTLIPGFSGVGTVLLGLLTRNGRTIQGGLWTIFGSLIAFAIFGSFLGAGSVLSQYWPVLLILLGLWLLVQALFRKR